MLTTNPTSLPSFSSTVPSPADFIGSTITYYNARPYQRQPLLATGTVIGWQVYKNLLMLKVQNTETCRERWFNAQFDFLSYALAVIRAEKEEAEDLPTPPISLRDIVFDCGSKQFGKVDRVDRYLGTLSFHTNLLHMRPKQVHARVQDCRYLGSNWEQAWEALEQMDIQDPRLPKRAEFDLVDDPEYLQFVYQTEAAERALELAD